jgi:glycerol-3-phosphate dehydrogenase
LLTITGGKWTTYRKMAADAVDLAIQVASLPERAVRTTNLPIHGAVENATELGHLSVFGADAPRILEIQRDSPALAEPLHADLPYTGAEVVWTARCELARTVEDVLARRTRALFLNARAALAMAPRVAELMASELGRDARWQEKQVAAFEELATKYLIGR